MRLQDRLPDSVTVNGRRYRLDLDFRNVLRMNEMLSRDDLIPGARAYLALRCLMKHPPSNAQPVLDAVRLLLFPEAGKPADKKKITDFEQDAGLIRAAFLQAYGINLYHARLHWLEFVGLLAHLPEGSRYSEVLGIRAREIPAPTKYNKAEREWLIKAKAACRLEMSEKERADNYARAVKSVFSGILAWANAQKGVTSSGADAPPSPKGKATPSGADAPPSPKGKAFGEGDAVSDKAGEKDGG